METRKEILKRLLQLEVETGFELITLEELKDIKGEYPVNEQQQLFDEYLQYLYYQNSGNEKKLGKLYDATKKAIMNWDGQFDSDTICIDDSNEKFWVLEQLLIKPAIYKAQASITGEVLRFSTTLKLRYRKANDTEIETAEISMDYALFEMVSAMKEGYRPTVQDKNQHADFVSFVQRIIEFGNKASRIVLVPKENEHDYETDIQLGMDTIFEQVVRHMFFDKEGQIRPINLRMLVQTPCVESNECKLADYLVDVLGDVDTLQKYLISASEKVDAQSNVLERFAASKLETKPLSRRNGNEYQRIM